MIELNLFIYLDLVAAPAPAPAPGSQLLQVSQAQPAPVDQGKNIDCNFIPNDLETWSGLLQPITSSFLLQEMNEE